MSGRWLGVSSLDAHGKSMYELMEELYPHCRSITGDGVRETLRILSERIPLEIHEVPSGKQVFDWVVPKEWNIREAWVRDARGKTVIDFASSNLHVLGYSLPVHRRVDRSELLAHLHTSPEQPRWIPYRNSFYEETWGFCIAHEKLDDFQDDEYEVYIDSSLADGHLTYGELFLPGEQEEEVLIHTHVCHPSLCNDNLSGMAVSTALAGLLSAAPRRYGYRFVFTPATIGAITWLSLNEATTSRIAHGLVLACLGDGGAPHYVRSRRGRATVDRAMERALLEAGMEHEIRDFSPYGYDQRQFCSPGFDLPAGCFMRTPNGEYREYHSSGDNFDLIRPEHLTVSLTLLVSALGIIEGDVRYANLNPKCEPQLGRRGLYGSLGGRGLTSDEQLALLWVLNFSDGNHGLLDIAERSGLTFGSLRLAADRLLEAGLLRDTAAAERASEERI